MLDRIRAALPSLSPAELRVGKLLLIDAKRFAKLSVSELASQAQVSKPTVVRFCRSIGYGGLSDFKRKLANGAEEGVPFIHRCVDADDKTGDILVKVIDNTMAAFLAYRHGANAVIISSSGRTRDLLDACAIARKNGATTIVMTASGTPLASTGHMHLAADHSELCERFIPMVSRLLHLLIIDVLATCVALRLDTGTLQPLLREVMHNLRSKRYG